MTETLLHSAQVSEEGGRDRKWRTAHFLFLLSSASCCNNVMGTNLFAVFWQEGRTNREVLVAEGVNWKCEDHEQKGENEKWRLVARR